MSLTANTTDGRQGAHPPPAPRSPSPSTPLVAKRPTTPLNDSSRSSTPGARAGGTVKENPSGAVPGAIKRSRTRGSVDPASSKSSSARTPTPSQHHSRIRPVNHSTESVPQPPNEDVDMQEPPMASLPPIPVPQANPHNPTPALDAFNSGLTPAMDVHHPNLTALMNDFPPNATTSMNLNLNVLPPHATTSVNPNFNDLPLNATTAMDLNLYHNPTSSMNVLPPESSNPVNGFPGQQTSAFQPNFNAFSLNPMQPTHISHQPFLSMNPPFQPNGFPAQHPPTNHQFSFDIQLRILDSIEGLDRSTRRTTQRLEDLFDQHQALAARVDGIAARMMAPAASTHRESRPQAPQPHAVNEGGRKKKKPIYARPNVTEREWSDFLDSIRLHYRNIARIGELVPSELRNLSLSLTEDEVKALVYDREGQCWTRETWRLDYLKPMSYSPNAAAIRLYVASYLAACRAGSFRVSDVLREKEHVKCAILQHIPYVKGLLLDAHDDDKIGNEDPRANRRRAQITRRATLYQRRLKAAHTRPSTIPHAQLLAKLSPEHMSEDETDTEEPTKLWRIIELSWRSVELTQMLRNLDIIYLENFYHQKGSNPPDVGELPKCPQPGDDKGPSRGNCPRVRVLRNNSAVVAGVLPKYKHLPKNCFDPVWFASQPEYVVAELEVDKKADYNFFIKPEDLRRTRPGDRWRH